MLFKLYELVLLIKIQINQVTKVLTRCTFVTKKIAVQ